MSDDTVAIIGMAGRFPSATGIDQFWANLRAGVDGISRFSHSELVAAGVDPALARRPDYVPARGLLPGAERFDWSFFGYSPAEAATIDPQQRLFLECASEAIDDAGLDPRRFPGWVGVFGGCDPVLLLVDGADDADVTGMVIGSDKDFLATRVAYKLGLRGPAVTVQTACSTALTAVHSACQSLLGYECDAALAGGVSALLPQQRGYRYQEGNILSRDGYCRPFDADASGTVAGCGVGVVVLKRFADAVENGDRIVALIRGSAINNDGGEKIGYTAPSIPGQRDVIRLALAQAGVDPADIGYVEAHGTATQVGDPVEVAALTSAFRESTDRTGYCWLGAVKANIGHLGAAAGIAGLIKTALLLQHRELVPTPHFRRPNPGLDLEASPFVVSDALRPWSAEGPLLAGISSFGIGGTNVHAILESAPATDRRPPRTAPRIFCLSATTPAGLDRSRAALADRIAEPGPRLDDVALTLAAGRRRFAHRAAIVAADAEQAVAALRAPRPSVCARVEPTVAFLFPGQGTLHPGAAAAAHRLLSRFRAVFDEINAATTARFGVDLAPLLAEDASADPAWLTDTVHQQLGIFALGYALGRQFETWGVTPHAMLGNSIGEYVAATLAGLWTVPDALTLVHERGQAMRSAPRGRMISVAASAEQLADVALGDAVLAVSGPGQVVLAGTEAAIDGLLAGGALTGFDIRPLETERAFHSPLMDEAAAALRAIAADTATSAPNRRFVSNVTGDWADPEQVRTADYWADHLRGAVRLDDGAATVLASGCTVFVELGAGSSMTATMRRHRNWDADASAVPLLRRTGTGTESLLDALATLWAQGLDLPLEELLCEDQPIRAALPAHPFEPTVVPVRRRSRPRPERAGAPSGLARAAWTQAEPGTADHDLVLLLGTKPGPDTDGLIGSLGGETVVLAPEPGEPPIPWHRERMVAAVAELTGRGPAAPLVIAALPDRVDPEVLTDLAALTGAADALGAPLYLVGRGLVDVLGGDETADGADLLAGWLATAPGRVALFDLGTTEVGGAPAITPGTGVYAWRGRRWWTRIDQPVPTGNGAGPSGAVVLSGGLAEGASLAADLAETGLAVRAYLDTDHPVVHCGLYEELPGTLAETVRHRRTAPTPLSQRPDLCALLDTFCAGLIGRFALDFGRIEPGATMTVAELHGRLDPSAMLPRFIDFMLNVLLAQGWLTASGDDRTVDPDLPGLVERALRAESGLDELAGLRALLRHCASAYPDVFAGKRDRVSVLNPDGDPTLMRDGLTDNQVNPSGDVAVCIEAVCHAVRATHARRGGQPLRVLEVGAGRGELTWPLLTGWTERTGLDYHFTDISPLMVRKAKARAEELGRDDMRFSVFDLTADPVAQGFAAGSYDLVLAYNAVHVAPKVRDTLGQLGSLLRPGGTLCFIEMTGVARWAHVMWGLTPGWWDFGEDRADAIHLDVTTWTTLLDETGYTGIAATPADDGADHAILLGSAPAVGSGPDDLVAALRRQHVEPGDGLVYLAAGADAFRRWSQLSGQVESRPALVVTEDQRGPADWRTELARIALDPADGADWCHVRVNRFGLGELRALPGLLAATGLPAATRFVPPPEPRPVAAEAELTAERAPSPPRAAEDPDPLRGLLAEQWCDVLGVRTVDDADDFFALGGESLMAVHFMGRIRERTGVHLAPAAFTKASTFGQLVELARTASPTGPVTQAAGAHRPQELVVFRDSGPRTPIFLAAPAIGTTLSYQGFADALGDDRPVYGIEATLPVGGSTRDRVRQVAAHHVGVLREVRPHGPYVLGGWSFGAVVAHEMAQQLTSLGERVELVVCVDGYVPATRGRRMRSIPGYLSTGAWYQLAALLRFGVVGDLVRVAPDVRRVFNANIRAVWQYRPSPVPAAAVVLKTRLDGGRAAWLRRALAPVYGGGVEVRTVPGNHWNVLDARHAPELAGQVRAALARIEDGAQR
jgi:acyl transferase domain-containing protein/thioesterase domain-containing protein/SAM-dependent methyltransferase/acyl carrier protein